MKNISAHLEEVNESYVEHFGHAMWFAMKMFVGASACAVHAICPCVFERTGSSTIADLYSRMVVNRVQPNTSDERSSLVS